MNAWRSGVIAVIVLVGCEPRTRGPVPAPADGDVAAARSDGGAAVASDAGKMACHEGLGAWSETVDGLRARLVTSAASRDGVDVDLEVENVSGAPLEVHWTGDLPLGFVQFHLDDAAGRDVEPGWRFGGNAPSGSVRSVFLPGKSVRYAVHHGAFGKMASARTIRIGAFWGRELPSDGSRRFLRGVIAAGPTHPEAPAYAGNEPAVKPPPARAWTGPLQVPAVCLE